MYADRLFNALERNDPVPGQLLVAAPDTLIPHFNRSVILIGEQDAGRTFGVDLTKRSEVALFNVMPEWLPLAAKPQALYVGGPQNDRNVAGVAMTRQGVDIDKEPALTRLATRLAYVDLLVGPEELLSRTAVDGDGLVLLADPEPLRALLAGVVAAERERALE